VLDWESTKWYYTPTKTHADLTALAALQPTALSVRAADDQAAPGGGMLVTIENTGKALAFQVHLEALDAASGEETLPVFWEDNYFALFPGERKDVRVSWPSGRRPARVTITAQAWNR
jgi:exo-1,4-beta-D-glucosaminidase